VGVDAANSRQRQAPDKAPPRDITVSPDTTIRAMELDDLRIFSRVAELGSFTRAAEQLGLTRARVSTAVQQLEARLGTRLLHRTTRAVRLTPDGEQCFERSRALLADADELAALFEQSPAALRGRVKLDLPNAIARSIVIPKLPEFLASHPLIEIDLSTTDRFVDLVNEGFDCVLRIGALVDSGLVAKRLGVMRQINFASPAYLQRYGEPRSLDDLAHHRVVHYAASSSAPPRGWEYVEAGQTRWQAMPGVVTVNSSDAYEAACVAGLGMIQAPALGALDAFSAGLLVAVMPAHCAPPLPVSLIYPNRRQVAKRVQAVMNWLAEVMEPQLDRG
jgi:DNA-binding transcriptional LysR family regulator